MTSATLPFDSEGWLAADTPVFSARRRQLIFRSHGIETKATPCGRVFIHDHWLDTNTNTWSSEWRDVTDWSKSRILDFLGY